MDRVVRCASRTSNGGLSFLAGERQGSVLSRPSCLASVTPSAVARHRQPSPLTCAVCVPPPHVSFRPCVGGWRSLFMGHTRDAEPWPNLELEQLLLIRLCAGQVAQLATQLASPRSAFPVPSALVSSVPLFSCLKLRHVLRVRGRCLAVETCASPVGPGWRAGCALL